MDEVQEVFNHFFFGTKKVFESVDKIVGDQSIESYSAILSCKKCIHLIFNFSQEEKIDFRTLHFVSLTGISNKKLAKGLKYKMQAGS